MVCIIVIFTAQKLFMTFKGHTITVQDTVHYKMISGILLLKMDTFSLEDEDCDELFITQSSSNGGDNSDTTEIMKSSPVLSDGNSFSEPLVSVLDTKYSDISDEDFNIPSSQKQLHSEVEVER